MERGDGGGPLGLERLGRYQLLRKIAVGGMAEIYLARVSGAGGFEKNVVVKRILPQLAESDEFFAMFLDEARIAATLQHPNLVHIYDAGQAGSDYFIAMEHLDGADLHTIRRVLHDRKQVMPIQHAVFIASAVAAGLHYAHEKLDLDGQPLSIVHRDVTPQNVFLTREGGVKLVDFGVAKAANRMSTTTYGTLKGKLAYMSPEQCRALPVDRRSDIYALGILLYELTTGRRPHRGKSEYELLREIVEGVIPPPRLGTPDYPVELEQIVMRALAPEPADRYPNALAMEQDLERFARRHALVGSTLALAEFLRPLLEDAQRQAEERYRRRLSGLQASEARADATEADRQVTVAAVLGRRHGRMPTPPAATPDGTIDEPTVEEAPSARRLTSELDQVIDRLPAQRTDVIRIRPRRTISIVLTLLLVGGGGAAAIYYDEVPGRADPHDAARPIAQAPATVAVDVVSDPPGAAVWLRLGPTPALSGPLDAGRAHRVRVEQEGYRSVDVEVGTAAFHAGPGAVVEIAAELEPVDRAEPAVAEPAESMTGEAGSIGHIRVSSRPPASAWLFVGVTPVRIEALPGERRQELRVAKNGYLPSFFTVGPERGSSGEALSLSASLVRREPGARRRR